MPSVTSQFGRCAARDCGRDLIAASLAVLIGVAAGWRLNNSGYGSIVEGPLFALICPLFISWIAAHHRILLGFLFSLCMCSTVIFLAMRLNGRIGIHWGGPGGLGYLVADLAVTGSLSLLATVPMTLWGPKTTERR